MASKHTKTIHHCSRCGSRIRSSAFFNHAKTCEGTKEKIRLAKNIRRLRLKKFPGLSQQRAAFALGISPQTLNRIELGKEWPRDATIRIIAEALKVRPSSLMA